MTISDVEEFVVKPNQKFHWQSFLPKRKAWIQTLILLPFGLPVGNFLGASWHFSVNSIVEGQYLIGVLSMAVNLLLPSLFFAFLFHWGWFVWRQEGSKTWYPQLAGLGAGAYATLTIAVSFGIVNFFSHSLGVCGNPGWGEIASNLLCNLDGYGFESKSWFGAWFVIAAYCYRAYDAIESRYERILHRRQARAQLAFTDPVSTERTDFGASSIDPISTHVEE